MKQKKWHGTLLYLGILGASVSAVGLRTLPFSDASTMSGQPVHSTPTTPAARPSTSAAQKPPTVSAAAVTVTGDPSSTPYGLVQVAVTFHGSQITDVTAIKTPNRDGRSVRIADQSVPTLHDEVLRSQSAQVDTVSGATYTSEGYARSVQSAIDQH